MKHQKLLGKLKLYGILAAALAFTVSCAHKKVSPNAGQNAGISNSPLSFPPDGSDSGNIQGLYTIHFAFNSSAIDGHNRQLLRKDSEWMKDHSATTVQIEGHCDQRGSIEYNLALGERRAKSVKSYLVHLGVDGGHLTVISYGKEKPIDSANTPEAWAKNRRANFVPLSN